MRNGGAGLACPGAYNIAAFLPAQIDMPSTTIRYTSFPRTASPPSFVDDAIAVFRDNEKKIATTDRKKGLTSDAVLAVLRSDLKAIGFDVEAGKRKAQKIKRPVFFGENGVPTLQYEIDAYHDGWRCGMEVEAGRAWMGNAVYRDLIQAMIMVQVDTLILAVSNEYRYNTGGRSTVNRDYENTCAVAQAVYGHSRVQMPYGLVVVGY